MYICAPCRKEMRCQKNGHGARWGSAHAYPGDLYRCPDCGTEMIATNARPVFDPDKTIVDIYTQMDGNDSAEQETVKTIPITRFQR